jgi:hypothetical protein
VTNVSYPVFSSIIHYLYTGDFHFGADTEGQERSLDYAFEFLRVADEYILEDVRIIQFFDNVNDNILYNRLS